MSAITEDVEHSTAATDRPARPDPASHSIGSPLLQDGWEDRVTLTRRIVENGHRLQTVHSQAEHSLIVTLTGNRSWGMSRVNRRVKADGAFAGSVSFTPAGLDRGSVVGAGRVDQLEILFPIDVGKSISGGRLQLDWSCPFHVRTPKIALVAETIAARGVPVTRVERCVHRALLTALIRRTCIEFGGLPVHPGDAWLHPIALTRVVGRIEADTGPQTSSAELAALAGLGPSAFLRAFRGTLGETPCSFIIARRIARAVVLLRDQ